MSARTMKLPSRRRQWWLLAALWTLAVAPLSAEEGVVSPLESALAEVDWVRSATTATPPTPELIALVEQLDRFEEAYLRWRDLGVAEASLWERLATELAARYQALEPSGEDGSLVVRGRLLAGEASLFASLAALPGARQRGVELYRRGVRQLDEILRLTAGRPELDVLPDFRYQLVVSTRGDTGPHPLAGYEYVGSSQITSRGPGTRYFPRSSLLAAARLEWEQLRRRGLAERRQEAAIGQQYRALARSWSELASDLVVQRPSSQTARVLLADFCPWGVDLYGLLEEAGLAADLDYRILRPYAGKTPPLYERPFAGTDDLPPTISEVVVRPPQVPAHVVAEMQRVVGDGRQGQLGGRSIAWDWAGEPTYSVWFLSPTIFDWQASDYLWFWFSAVKLAFAGLGDVLVDEVLGALLAQVASGWGEASEVYAVSRVLVEANDKGFLTSFYVTQGEWLSAAGFARKLGGLAFGALEEQIRQGLYQGIDPRRHSPGTTYDGGPIPPVILRADVMAFERVAEDEYVRDVQAVRFYTLRPENLAHRGPYQGYDLSGAFAGSPLDAHRLLRRDQYLSEQAGSRPDGSAAEPVRKLAWDVLADPLGRFEIASDFSPWRQLLRLPFTQPTAAALAKASGLRAELWSAGAGEAVRHLSVPLGGGTGSAAENVVMELFNANDPMGRAGFQAEVMAGPGALTARPATPEAVDRLKADIEARVRDRSDALTPVRSRYEVRFTQHGRRVGSFPVHFDRGRRGRRQLTGRLGSPERGAVELVYAPPIDLLRLEVTRGALQAASAGPED